MSADLMPFFTYFGGKYRTAPRYPEPRYATIIEPFAGSAGYATRYHQRKVLLFDLDPIVAGTWEYLIGVSPDEIRRLPLWDETWDNVDELDLPQEARWLIGWWLNKGTSSPRKSPTTRMRSGCRPKSHWGPVIRERIATQVDAIRHWEIRCASYEEVPNAEASWFIDPPYQEAGCSYRCGPDDIDFTHLAGWCRERIGQVTVCESEGADWLPFRQWIEAKAMNGIGRRGRSTEVAWFGVDEVVEQGVLRLEAS